MTEDYRHAPGYRRALAMGHAAGFTEDDIDALHWSAPADPAQLIEGTSGG